MTKKTHLYIALLIGAVLFLAGCLGGGAGTSYDQATSGTIVLDATVAPQIGQTAIGSVEFILENGDHYCLGMATGSGTEFYAEYEVPFGVWQLQAVARDVDGNLVGFSTREKIAIADGRQRLVPLLINPVAEDSVPNTADWLVTNLNGTGQDGTVFLNWDIVESASDEASGIEVYRRAKDAALWTRIDSVPYNEIMYEDNSPTVDGWYEYAVRVVGVDGSDTGPLSASAPLYVGIPKATLQGTIEFLHDFTLAHNRPPVSRGWYPGFEQNGLDTPTGEVVVHFNSAEAFAGRADALADNGLEIVDELPSLLAVLAQPMHQTQRIFPQSMGSEREGERDFFIEPNRSVIAPASITPNDRYYQDQWNMDLIQLPYAWDITRGDDSIRIAVVDTGIDADHPDLAGQVDVASGYNTVTNTRNTIDVDGHGTHVAGIIGAQTNNRHGVAGVMWNVELVPVKVFPDNENATDFNLAKGILYAAGLDGNLKNPEPVDVINMSVGAEVDSAVLRNAIQKVAAETDIIMIAASGNSRNPSEGGVMYPAAYSEVIAIGAVEHDGDGSVYRAWYSHYGEELDLVAPGGGNPLHILSTTDGGYFPKDGTSMAAPHVSGVVGLMLAAGIPPSAVRPLLTSTAMDLGAPGFDVDYGHGLVNAYWAVSEAQSVQILVGSRVEDRIEAVAQTKIPLSGGVLDELETRIGEYRVYAFLDLGTPGKIDPGDYLYESDPIQFRKGDVIMINMPLRQVSKPYSE